MRRRKLIKNILSEGLMLGYKKFPDRYFNLYTRKEFPKSEINEHPWWYKEEYNENGKIIYREYNDGYWQKREYDKDGNEIYLEDRDGIIRDKRNRIQEGLMLGYKKFPDKYFDRYTRKEFPKSEIDKHPQWYKTEYDNNGNEIYIEFYDGDWRKYEYNADENMIYMEDDDGYWAKWEYDADGNLIYYENSRGQIEDNRNRIQEGLMLPYRKKIEYSDLLPQIKKFNNTVDEVFDVVLFEYSDHMGGNFDIRFQINATAGFYEFNYYWSYDNANYITLFIWHVDFATEYEKKIYNDTIKINDVNDLNEELIDYTQNIIDNILPQVTEYYG